MSWLTEHVGTFVTTLCGSALGGGVVVAAIEWIRTARADRATRNTLYLSEQLRSLYGPLYFFYSLNDSLFKVCNQHEGIQRELYENNPAAPTQDISDAIAVTNRYVDRIIENNNKMIEILETNYGLIDPEDSETFQQIVTHAIRYQVEYREQPRPPLGVTMALAHVAPIHFFRPDFFEAIQDRFRSKKNELKQLREQSNYWIRRRQ
jgi:hypothetical protein